MNLSTGQWWADLDGRARKDGYLLRIGRIVAFRDSKKLGRQVKIQWRYNSAIPKNRVHTWVTERRLHATKYPGYLFLGDDRPPMECKVPPRPPPIIREKREPYKKKRRCTSMKPRLYLRLARYCGRRNLSIAGTVDEQITRMLDKAKEPVPTQEEIDHAIATGEWGGKWLGENKPGPKT